MARDQYQTFKEVAERLSVCEATIHFWMREGALRAIDIGKSWPAGDSARKAFLRQHAARVRGAEDGADVPAAEADPTNQGKA